MLNNGNSISMKKSIYNFSRVLGAFLLCTGLVFAGCTDDPLGDNQKTEQGGNENNGNETPEPEPLVTASIQNITYKDVEVTGKLNVLPSDLPFCKVVVYYSSNEIFNVNAAEKVSVTTFDNEQKYAVTLTGLDYNTKYNYCVYVKSKSDELYTEIAEFTTSQHPYLMQTDINISSVTDLSSFATSNSYIVSEDGIYKFKAVKGNSSTSVGDVASVAILWETFGTDTKPELLDLISGVCYKDGYIAFQTADTFKEGNAVIAAKDADGNILWSWHIWFTDQLQGQVYYNNAGVMMDRNLGATSATPGDVGALGLLYQWGRKDPFLGSSSISSSREVAKSTITWPPAVSTSSSSGTVSYVTANPTTFVEGSSSTDYDWHYSSHDNTLWTPSDEPKSIYDPCPDGWRVPDGGSNGVWSTALGSSSYFEDGSLYSSTNEGMNFSGKFGSAQSIWYPASGRRYSDDGSLSDVGGYGYYWSASPYNDGAYALYFVFNGSVSPKNSRDRANGYSVRCIQE